MHQAGISIRGRVKDLEDDVPADALERRIVEWPLRMPKRARKGNANPGAGRQATQGQEEPAAGPRLAGKKR